jgi:tRNA A58 N-methylase Trm61
MSMQGQIIETSDRGKLLQEVIKKNKFKNIVEIGTWKGMGSTLSVLKSMGSETNFITLESNPEFHSIAKNNLRDYDGRLEIIYGRIIEVSEVEEFVKDYDLSIEQKDWLVNDINNFKNCPNVLEKMPAEIDFLILDGGEFSTYPEWLKLKDRTKFIALDDINVLKTKRIYTELLTDKNYELLNITNEGNGFCLFMKK